MESDRELLELAAKASGLKDDEFLYIEGCYEDYYWTGPTWGLQIEGINGIWNPITDDGDALRLAVCLGLNVGVRDGFTRTWIAESSSGETVEDTSHEGDKYAATRKAIVRAAAEIGKQMNADKAKG